MDSKTDIVFIEADKIDDALIGVKTLAIIGGILAITFLGVKVIGIAKTNINYCALQYQRPFGLLII